MTSLIANLRNIRTSVVRILIFLSVTVLVNLYWIAPIFQSYWDTGTLNIRPDETLEQEAVRRRDYFQTISQPLSNLLTFTIPFGLNTEFVYPFDDWTKPIFVIASTLLIVFAFLAVGLKSKKTRNANLVPIILLFIVGIGLTTGARTLIGTSVYSALYRFFPILFAGFSNPLRFMPLFILPLSILVYRTISHIDAKLYSLKLAAFRILVFSIMLVFLYPWIFRSLLKPVVPGDSQPLSLKVQPIHPDDKKIFDLLGLGKEDYRFAFLPPSFLSWPGDTDHTFIWTSFHFQRPVFLQFPQQPLASIILQELYGGHASPNLGKLLALANVRKFIYPRYRQYESYHTYLPDTRNYKPIVDRNWSQQSGITQEQSFLASIDIYSNSNILPHIYTAVKNIHIDGNSTALVDISSYDDFDLRSAAISSESVQNRIKVLPTALLNKYVIKPERASDKNTIRIRGQDIYPPVRILPTSPFYFLIQIKEGRLMNAVKDIPESRAYADLVLMSKRISEIKRMRELKQDSYEVMNIILLQYRKLLTDFTDTLEILDGDISSRDDLLATSKIFLDDHQKNLLTITEELMPVTDTTRLKQIIAEVGKSLSTINSQLWMNTDELEIKYTMNVTRSGEYDLYISPRLTNVESIELDNNPLDLLQKKFDDNITIVGPVTLEAGIHRMLVRMSEPDNLFSDLSSTENIIKPNTGTVLKSYQLSSMTQNTMAESVLSGLDDLTKYKISFKYKAEGNPLRVTVEQSNDEIVNDSVKYKIDSYISFSDKWQRFEGEFITNLDSLDAAVRLYVPADIHEADRYFIEEIRIYKVVEPKLFLKNRLSPNPSVPPRLIFTRVNPTKYNVQVSGATEPYMLIFSESYHQGWKAYINEGQETLRSNSGQAGDRGQENTVIASYFNGEIQEGEHKSIFWDPKIFSNLWKKPIPDENHLLVNAYANAWFIEKPGDYEITLEFVPQRTYFIALMISGITLVGVAIGLGDLHIKKRRYDAN